MFIPKQISPTVDSDFVKTRIISRYMKIISDFFWILHVITELQRMTIDWKKFAAASMHNNTGNCNGRQYSPFF